MRLVFARDAEENRRVEVTGRDDHVTRLQRGHAAILPERLEREIACTPRDAGDFLVLADVEIELSHDALVIAKRFPAIRLVTLRNERNAAELELLGGAEERHVRGIASDRRHDARLVEQHT